MRSMGVKCCSGCYVCKSSSYDKFTLLSIYKRVFSLPILLVVSYYNIVALNMAFFVALHLSAGYRA